MRMKRKVLRTCFEWSAERSPLWSHSASVRGWSVAMPNSTTPTIYKQCRIWERAAFWSDSRPVHQRVCNKKFKIIKKKFSKEKFEEKKWAYQANDVRGDDGTDFSHGWAFIHVVFPFILNEELTRVDAYNRIRRRYGELGQQSAHDNQN